TSVVEINMKNFSRWLDGVYDANLLSGTTAVSTNIGGPDGYILYVSDRRGDRVKGETIGSTVYNMTNGLVDNEDIYGWNGILDPGEDVIDAGADGSGNPKQGTLQRDTAELPDPTPMPSGTPTTTFAGRTARAVAVAAYQTPYFRRAVRLVNGDTLTTSMSGTNKLSQTRGITVSTENMLYVWGNYNTTGVNNVPTGGASLAADYSGPQVPASLVSDALFPLSRTWFDASSAMFPDDLSKRIADLTLDATGNVATVPMGSETSVRTAVIAGNNMSALAGSPDAGNANGESRLSGGIHNFPRFSERWSSRWNFIGSLVPLYYSTQALGPYNADSTIYGAPVRNWAFDDSFKDPSRLPPGTPMFQYIEPTGFTQVMY
ncbi:MAG TPA: hypothetical protein VLJ61_05885, partial [Pyrinomonadaceae bacterium]|nr:hypothetical protein [Pyrinomonadaceae bacterium]